MVLYKTHAQENQDIEDLTDETNNTLEVSGFSVVFDKLCNLHYPRRFDAWNHTQLYTEESLQYAREKSGFRTIAEWRFGQDFEDFLLSAIVTVDKSNSKVEKRIIDSIRDSIDSLQISLDRAYLSDAIHVIWQKE